MNGETNIYQSPSNLEAEVTSELRVYLESTPVESNFKVEPNSNFLSSLEYYIPLLLSQNYVEWEYEGLDGFYLTNARKTGLQTAELYGLAILISDQATTPFFLRLTLKSSFDSIKSYKILLGEPGGGKLGISKTRNDVSLIETLNPPLEQIHWRYTLTSDAS